MPGSADMTEIQSPSTCNQDAKLMLPAIRIKPISSFSRAQLKSMLEAGHEVMECRRVLEKAGLNLVGEILKGQGTFVEYSHYPEDDVFDEDTQSQYYYHAHRGTHGEHGHFHTFLRRPAEISGAKASTRPLDSETESAEDIVHIVSISMDPYGWPIGLFTTNRWVTGERFYDAIDVISMLNLFRIDHAYPSWPVNRWITAMFVLYRPHIEALLWHRDQVIVNWSLLNPNENVYEDRNLEITGLLPIDPGKLVQELKTALRK